jgi:hypothetical protein
VKSLRESLLETIASTRGSLALAEAAKRQDWTEAARLQNDGADIMHRDKAALKELAASDAIAVADIMEKAPAFSFPPLMTYTLARAAETGNAATIAHIIAKQPSVETLNFGLCRALIAKQDAAVDLLQAAVPEQQIANNALFGFLLTRPAEYERLVEAREKAPDYLMHFLNACNFKDKPAIDLSLDKMVDGRACRRNTPDDRDGRYGFHGPGRQPAA